MVRVNVGCGQSPTKGWKNIDNSLSLHLSKIPFFALLLQKIGVLDSSQYQFIQFARKNSIEYGNVARRLCFSDHSVDVIYSAHMLEHLKHNEVDLFLKEARRVLRSSGIIRLAVPDLNKYVAAYVENNDADAFVLAAGFFQPQAQTFAQRLWEAFLGPRNHQWIYDGKSLCRLLLRGGFLSPKILKSGETLIDNPGELNLREREGESVFVEAINP